MRVLIVDDMQARHDYFKRRFESDSVEHAYDADQAIDMMRRHRYDMVSLDHDLGSTSRNGLYVANAIVAMPECSRPDRVCVHTANPIARRMMVEALKDAGIMAEAFVPLV
jgi:CheY-like chemotaxis protein